MSVHDWSLVPVGIFHDLHHAWIKEIKRYSTRVFCPATIMRWLSSERLVMARMFWLRRLIPVTMTCRLHRLTAMVA